MIKVEIKNREITLVSTIQIPAGNHNTIPFFVNSFSGDIWNDTEKSAVFFAVTKRGEIKVVECLLDISNQCLIPGSILNESNSKLSVSVKGVAKDGSIVSSKRLPLGVVCPGSEYASEDITQELSETEFDKIMRAIADMKFENSDTLRLFSTDEKKNLYFNGQRIASLPAGGSEGQVLEKKSDDDFDYGWGDTVTLVYNAGSLTVQ